MPPAEPELLDGWTLAGRVAPSRVLFGPHETNLGRGRSLSAGHVEHYRRRAAGGAGILVVETASVHPDDWPYERAPLASECGPGWAAVAAACHPHSSLVLAGLGHAGGQGSSARSQAALWAPSRFTDPISGEQPAPMEAPELTAVVDGFAAAAHGAAGAGLDGVEVDAGPRSLLRQFHSPLSNIRADHYGADRLRLTREVLHAVRGALGPGRVLTLRLSCDELAPWGGVTAEQACEQVRELAPLVDLLVVVRGGPYSTTAYRPDAHTPTGFNARLCQRVRTAAAGVPVVLQGSVVSIEAAEAALAGGVCDAVEMTRALIADADLVVGGRSGRNPRPCVRCNQTCLVRDDRNPRVSCIGDPGGYEVVPATGEVLVVGGGPAGLEAARVAAQRGFTVQLIEQGDRLGGMVRTAAVAAPHLGELVNWLEAQCRHLGVRISTGQVRRASADSRTIVATGSRPRLLPWPALTAPEVLDGAVLPDGPVLLDDPVGGPVAVALAERLVVTGRDVAIITPDSVVGARLAVTGDLAEANGRLQRAGVARMLSSTVFAVGDGVVTVSDRFTGVRRELACGSLIDCGHRVADESVVGGVRVGDCVAPRTIAEAVREGRAAALALA